MAIQPASMHIEAVLELLSEGYAVRFRAGGQSMHPTIKDGEMITVEPVTAPAVKRGDIVLYRSKNGVIAHRVVRAQPASCEPRLILRGDALTSSDSPVALEQVLGRVALVERCGRSIKLAGGRARLVRAARFYWSRLKARLNFATLKE